MAKSHPAKGIEGVEMRRVPPEEVEEYDFNFMLVDDIGFRFESDRSNAEAVVFFHYTPPEGIEDNMPKLKGIFDRMWDSAEVLAYPLPRNRGRFLDSPPRGE